MSKELKPCHPYLTKKIRKPKYDVTVVLDSKIYFCISRQCTLRISEDKPKTSNQARLSNTWRRPKATVTSGELDPHVLSSDRSRPYTANNAQEPYHVSSHQFVLSFTIFFS
ncbi:hypothetical protein TNCV_3248511 [Trichonephila clavipes]|nr:hypothetical protein TNCV_3248511 [Trichonephila clavipes]